MEWHRPSTFKLRIVKPTLNCVTLPVNNLQQSFRFYRETLGLSADEPEDKSDHVAFTLADRLYLVIILRSEFVKFTAFVDQADAPQGVSECVLSYFAGSSAEVDATLEKARRANALAVSDAKEQDWGYAGYFKDPDGHLWEIMWNKGL